MSERLPKYALDWSLKFSSAELHCTRRARADSVQTFTCPFSPCPHVSVLPLFRCWENVQAYRLTCWPLSPRVVQDTLSLGWTLVSHATSTQLRRRFFFCCLLIQKLPFYSLFTPFSAIKCVFLSNYSDSLNSSDLTGCMLLEVRKAARCHP